MFSHLIFFFTEETICWTFHTSSSGGKGVEFQITSTNNTLLEILTLENIGWVGMGKARACIAGNNFEKLDSDQFYAFNIQGTSVLFKTTTSASFTFHLSSSKLFSSRFSPRQTITCDPSLWDSSPTSLYGIQTFPSGHTLLPPSLRSSPLVITTKALSPCPQIGMSKDILMSSSFFWEFLGELGGDLNPNDWVRGTKLVIPETILKDRDVFPPNQPVALQVTVDIVEGDLFTAGVIIEFLPSPVEMKISSEFSSIYDVNDLLVIDFSDSYTLDGVVVGGDGWEWEWEWTCVIPGERGEIRECVYSDGAVVEMPGEMEQRFEGEEGKKFEEGVPLFFSIKGRVRREGGDGVVAEGTWSSVVNPVGGLAVGLELREDYWMCSDSSVGFQVCLYIYTFLFFPLILICHFFCRNWSSSQRGQLTHLKSSHFGMRFFFFFFFFRA